MAEEPVTRSTHLPGESGKQAVVERELSALDTFGGKVFIRWDPDANVTGLGPAAYFIEFLKTNGLWKGWVEDCPLYYTSPNAPPKQDILGTVMLSVLAGHKRYAHITTVRSDNVLPQLLGMTRVRSEDAVRRAFQHGQEEPWTGWTRKHLAATYEPLLSEGWILDMDATVKPLYGHQEKAAVGYNPRKPGRPSHVYHCYFIAAIRLIVEVEVQAGNQTASQYAQPGLWAWLDARPREQWPHLLRGDISWGTERMMQEAEQRELPYLFKLKKTAKVNRHIEKLWGRKDWAAAGAGWEGLSSELQLTGWSRTRRVVILRRQLRETVAVSDEEKRTGQRVFSGMAELKRGQDLYEYTVLVTSLGDEVLSLAQLYRDRAEAENIFDELKNQWGWTGFTTQDVRRCQILARTIAVIYNWWTLFTRLAIPNRHTEAITSRPLLLHGVARQTTHSNQAMLTITSMHAQAPAVRRALAAVSTFLQRVRQTAEQFASADRWRAVLRFIYRDWLSSAGDQQPNFAVLRS
ncbi:MAG TPA: transposase [Gammaproteobacteria bacterium]|nr:transposase [Gammaproteobacteria bacterium]